MNHLIIIGNGFDLAHGLKTSYRDYVRAMLIDECITRGKTAYKDSPFKGTKLKNSQADQRSKGQLKSLPDESLVKLYVKDHEPRGKNVSTFVRTLVEDLGGKGWVDLEEAYHSGLLQRRDRKEEVLELNRDMDLLTKSLLKYLRDLFKGPHRATQPVSMVQAHFDDIHRDINGEEPSGTEKGEVRILTFNYTSTLDLYEDNLPEAKVIHIHGSLHENNILLGYGDESSELYKELEKMNDNDLTKYFKSFYYARSTRYEDLFRFLDSGEFRVHLMGHSCGLSDRVLLSNIFQHEQLEKVKIYYHDKDSGQNNFLYLVQNISRHFADKHRMRRKILPFSDGNGAHEDNKDRSVPLIRVGE